MRLELMSSPFRKSTGYSVLSSLSFRIYLSSSAVIIVSTDKEVYTLVSEGEISASVDIITPLISFLAMVMPTLKPIKWSVLSGLSFDSFFSSSSAINTNRSSVSLNFAITSSKFSPILPKFLSNFKRTSLPVSCTPFQGTIFSYLLSIIISAPVHGR